MGYGDKYARVFSDDVRGKLSDDGKKWVDNTRRLLQEKIEEKIASGEMNELDAEAFKEVAFEMHSDAYLERVSFSHGSASRARACGPSPPGVCKHPEMM